MILDSKSKNQIKIIAPGRVCLFGDHQDYLGLPVIACAIDRKITLTATPNLDKTFNISLPDIDANRVISIREEIDSLQPRDYFASTLRVVKRYGCIPNMGYNISITGTIPINAGVSSSSALVVAWVHFLLKAYGPKNKITLPFIAQLAYESEVTEHNEPGGKMDQYTSSIGKILHIQTGEPFHYTTLGDSIDGLILSDSGVSKTTIEVLAKTKNMVLESIQCVVEKIPGFILNDVHLNTLDQYLDLIPHKLQPYFIAAIKNHDITKQAMVEFSRPVLDLERIGHLLTQHHVVLKDILKITVPKIDAMIDAAIAEGAYGAKIVGSGGGGCIVILSPPEKKEIICKRLTSIGARSSYSVSVSNGTHELSDE